MQSFCNYIPELIYVYYHLLMTETLTMRYYIAFQLRVSDIPMALTEKYYHHYKKEKML